MHAFASSCLALCPLRYVDLGLVLRRLRLLHHLLHDLPDLRLAVRHRLLRPFDHDLGADVTKKGEAKQSHRVRD